MSNIYNKEDMGLCSDIESQEEVSGLYGELLDNALDNPVNRMAFLFPNKKFPDKSVKDIKLRIVSVNIDIPLEMGLDAIVTMWSAKTGKSSLDLDIMCNMIIDADFRLMTEMEVEKDWVIINKKRSADIYWEKNQVKHNLLYEEDEDDFFIPEEDYF
jgi:hypothetical protein